MAAMAYLVCAQGSAGKNTKIIEQVIVHDTITTNTVVSIPVQGKTTVHVIRDTVGGQTDIVLDTVLMHDTVVLDKDVMAFVDTVQLTKKAKLYATYLTKAPILKSFFKLDLISDTVKVRETITKEVNPIRIHGTTILGLNGVGAGFVLSGNKVLAGYGYTYDPKNKSTNHQIFAGWRIGKL